MELTLLAAARSSINWNFFYAALAVNLVIIISLLILAIPKILHRGKGIEKPIWIGLCLIFPIIMPIIALFYFKKKA